MNLLIFGLFGGSVSNREWCTSAGPRCRFKWSAGMWELFARGFTVRCGRVDAEKGWHPFSCSDQSHSLCAVSFARLAPPAASISKTVVRRNCRVVALPASLALSLFPFSLTLSLSLCQGDRS